MANGVSNIQDASAKTFAELLSGPVVDVYVGETKKHWSLHRNLLCHHSEYLQELLVPGEHSKKRVDNKIELPDHDPAGFELFVKWIYQGRIEDVSEMSDDDKYDYAVRCQRLWVLCDKFDMPVLKNIVIDQYRKGLGEAGLVPDAEEINEIYRRSPEGSPFRKLMTKIAARQIMDPDNDNDVESYRMCFDGNADFAVDLINAIKAGTGGMLFDDPTEGDECEYHDHLDGPNCRNKGKERQGTRSRPARRRPSSTDSSNLNRQPVTPDNRRAQRPSPPITPPPERSSPKSPSSPTAKSPASSPSPSRRTSTSPTNNTTQTPLPNGHSRDTLSPTSPTGGSGARQQAQPHQQQQQQQSSGLFSPEFKKHQQQQQQQQTPKKPAPKKIERRDGSQSAGRGGAGAGAGSGSPAAAAAAAAE